MWAVFPRCGCLVLLPSHWVLYVELTPPPPNREPSKPHGLTGATYRCGQSTKPPHCQGHPVSQGVSHCRRLLGSILCSGGDIPRGCRDLLPAAHCFLQPLAHTNLLSFNPSPFPAPSRSIILSPHLPSQFSSLVCPFSTFFALSQPFSIFRQPASGSSNLKVRTVWPDTISHGRATGSTVLRIA